MFLKCGFSNRPSSSISLVLHFKVSLLIRQTPEVYVFVSFCLLEYRQPPVICTHVPGSRVETYRSATLVRVFPLFHILLASRSLILLNHDLMTRRRCSCNISSLCLRSHFCLLAVHCEMKTALAKICVCFRNDTVP